MILVVDCGSTKADWMMVGDQEKKFSTTGFNPYFNNEAFILNALNDSAELREIAKQVNAIYFFGAGCSSEERKNIIENALSKFFISASIHVDHDVMGSVVATCGDEPGIACILGTGSNSCYFDGKNLHENNYGLGFIMGDEGSGSYLGKKLISNYLYKRLPVELEKKFEDQFVMTKEIMIANVYNNSKANVWLASFAKFMIDHKEDQWVNSIVTKGIEEFFEISVCGYSNYQKLKTHYVGSIAFYFEAIVRKVGREKGAEVGKIIQHPINGIADYYQLKQL